MTRPRQRSIGTPSWTKPRNSGLFGAENGVSEDSSRRDQIEQRLKATEERFRIAQVAGGIGWFEWDLVTDAWECTPKWRCCSVSTLRLADWQPAIFIDDVPKLRSAVEVSSERGPYYVEFRVATETNPKPTELRRSEASAPHP